MSEPQQQQSEERQPPAALSKDVPLSTSTIDSKKDDASSSSASAASRANGSVRTGKNTVHYADEADADDDDPPRGGMSSASRVLLSESRALLNLTPSGGRVSVPAESSSSSSALLGLPDLPIVRSRSSSPDVATLLASAPARQPPPFKRVDFDDCRIGREDTRPAWKQWQESVEDGFSKAKRTVERQKDEIDFQTELHSHRPRKLRGDSPFGYLDSESFLPRKSSWLESGALQPRNVFVDFSPYVGPYAAPAVSSSQGSESTRWSRRADELEQSLLAGSRARIGGGSLARSGSAAHVTAHDFRAAPAPIPGGLVERTTAARDEDDSLDHNLFAPRSYYSRPSRTDPDYFDYDLRHSVDLYKSSLGKYTPRGPQDWETKLLSEVSAKGDAPLSGYLFTKGPTDYRSASTSYLSAALRTPRFWEQRFMNMGQQVRESNPVSLDSIARNRPTPNRFTEYRDPDLEGLSDGSDEE